MIIELVYALPDKQHIEVLEVAESCTVKQALDLSIELKKQFPDMLIDEQQIGVFGKHVELSRVLFAKDRIEIYRPLQIEPKEARRRRAEKQKADKQK